MEVINEENVLVTYKGDYLSSDEATDMFEKLKLHSTKGKCAEGMMRGVKYKLQRKILQICDEGIRKYRFNGADSIETHDFKSFPFLDELRNRLGDEMKVKFNFVLVNFYYENCSLGLHSDDERDMVEDSIVAAISLGDRRRFALQKREGGEKKIINLDHGYLLTMEKKCQKFYKHEVMKRLKKEEKKFNCERISLTFRTLKIK